jgi:hypothetical protein
MTAGRRRAWWNVVSGAELTEQYWKHKCRYLEISITKDNRCSVCGLNEEEYGRLKSKGSEGGISGT